MFFNRPIILAVLLSVFCSLAHADKALWRDPVWLRLLHYERSLPGSQWRSAIHDADFFLTAGGPTDPAAELQAMLAALQAPAAEPGQSALCRFPARALWLSQRLALDIPHPFEHCPALREWTRQRSIESVSLVLATGYLGNPASYYGHTLLKLNFSKQAVRSRLRDTSINYGAIAAQQDDPISYIFKGVFGGYDGGFSESEYFMLENNYAENEFRDIWEYRLQQTPVERDLLVAHIREVLGRRYTYYFFRENCAYRIAELLELTGQQQFIPAYRLWTIPQTVLQQLEPDAGEQVLHSVHYWPSRQARFYRRLDALDAEERSLFTALAQGDADFAAPDFGLRPVDSRQRILDTLLDYSQYVRDTETQQDAQTPLYRAALRQRFLLPQGVPALGAVSQPQSPHLSRKASWIQMGVLRSDGLAAMSLRIRPAYYDWLDAGPEHVTHAALSMADLTLAIRDDEVRLRRLDLMAIETANPGRSGLPGDRGIAWNLKAAIEPVHLACDDCLVPRLASDIGLGRQLDPRLYVAAYVGGALQNDREDAGYGYARVALRMLYQPMPGTGLRAEVARLSGFAGDQHSAHQLELRQGLGEDFDLRLRYEYNEAVEVSLGLGYYW